MEKSKNDRQDLAMPISETFETEKEDSPIKIALLINSSYFFVELAFIVDDEQDGFRLVASTHGNVLMDERYESVKGAKIAFLKFFDYRACREGIRSYWSDFYSPEPGWLEARLPEKK